MRIAEAIKLLAAPFPIQSSFLRDAPENSAVPGFRLCDDIYRMAVLYLDSMAVYEGEGGTEGEPQWRARTQISSPSTLPTEWLSTALHMLVDLRKPFLFTRHGLRSAHEWRLIRHLAGQVCDAMDWPRELHYANFESLWSELGDGVLNWDGPDENQT
jgi:hypothetical protein